MEMNKEDRNLDKLRILMNAVEAIGEEELDFLGELKEVAFEYLLANPGSEFADWRNGLLEQYPLEVVDALGSNPDEVCSELANIWESSYCDPVTGIEQKFCEWAMTFANELAVGIYYFHMDACKELKRMGRKVPI